MNKEHYHYVRELKSKLGLINWHLLGNCNCLTSMACTDTIHDIVIKAILLPTPEGL